ncbi:penicillin-binding protein 2 [Acidihalobacter yilgarnensis]|uniref:Penicillin-binding protein 2 n=1 Tax=Acidihalobacter yilgarnensis TaxID=2819280 RepID=A0A1D8IQE0_9GAMM|nr:penicillin-binding protein 2 [Acidihalobacter yilgarnensis]AOU98720.1 penicillin-binding protein 2 [Acidihalobacter yilgarnensis]
MKRRDPLADPASQKRLFNYRTLVTALAVILLFMAAIARLVQLQIFDHKDYAQAARENRVRVQPIPPPRGLIYSRSGQLLAENVPSYTLAVIPDETHDLASTLKALAKIVTLSPEDLRSFKALRSITPGYREIPLATHLSQATVARFAVNRYRFPGVEIQSRLRRYYPYTALTADTIGYVGRISETDLKHVDPSDYAGTVYFGKSGLELTDQSRLHGHPGYKVMEVDADGQPVGALKRQLPTPGADLILTLDIGLQRVAQQAMKGKRGAVVVMNPRSGAILAAVSNPAYNPNWFVDGISSRRYQELVGSPGNPLWNRAFAASYAPGSMIKPFIALAGLNARIIKPQTEVFSGPYYIIPGDKTRHKFWDWTPYGHGWTNLTKAIAQSVDTYFYPLAYQLGIRRIDDMLSRFGFGQRPPLGMPGVAAGVLPSPAWKRRTQGHPWYPGDTVLMGIGQGYLQVTPLQLATAVSEIAMRGHASRPHLLRAIRNPVDGRIEALPSQPLPAITLKHEAYWGDVIAGMQAVIDSPAGTAYQEFHGFPLPVAGKTGTAQVYANPKNPFLKRLHIPYRLRDNALFEAFTPVKHPELVVVVIVEHAGDRLGPASGVTRKIMNYWLAHRQAIEHPVAPLSLQPFKRAATH